MTMIQWLLLVYPLLLFGVLLLGVKKAKKGEFHEDFLSLDVSKGLQGFAALGIILHHTTQSICNVGTPNPFKYQGMISIFNDYGVAFTAIFFFFSGYGLYTSLKEKPDYLKHFFRNRLSTILVPFYVITIIFFIFNLIFGMKPTLPEALTYLLGLILLNNNLWYIVEIAVLYIVFYIIFKLIKNKDIALVVMGIFVVLLITMSLLLGHDYKTASGGLWFHGEWWFNTTFTFFVGMLIARFKEPVICAIKKCYFVILPISIIFFFVMYKVAKMVMEDFGYYCEGPGYPGYQEKLYSLLAQWPFALSFVLMLLLISMKFQFKNKLLSFIGKIAIELYMIHRLFILVFDVLIPNEVLFIGAVYVASIIVAYLLHIMDGKIIKLIKK